MGMFASSIEDSTYVHVHQHDKEVADLLVNNGVQKIETSAGD